MASYASDAFHFQSEGKENLEECLKIAMTAVLRHGLEKLVVFTARGDGLHLAIELQHKQTEFSNVKLVGVTFPQGKLFTKRDGQQPPTRIEPERLQAFRAANISLVKARLPFDPIWSAYPTNTTVSQELSLIGNALNIFGGGMSLCIQAVLMACDAGEVEWGEHVVVMTSDTALLVRAAPTDHFLTDLIVREILCKPIFLTVTRGEEVPASVESPVDESAAENGEIALLGVPEDFNTEDSHG